jgi:hypothetical protein
VATIPSEFRAGDYVSWTEYEAPTGTTAIRAYLRTSAASGATVDATASGSDWFFGVDAATTTGLTAGSYLAQFVATVATKPVTYREVAFKVLPSLAYTGSPTAIETRSAAKIRLDSVEAAIDALTSGAQEYQIGVGSGGRRVRRADLKDLATVNENCITVLSHEGLILQLKNVLENYQYAAIWHMAHVTPMV